MSRQLLIDTFDPSFHIGRSEDPVTALEFVEAVKDSVKHQKPFGSHDAMAALIRSVASELIHNNPRWSGAEWLEAMIGEATELWVAEYAVRTQRMSFSMMMMPL
ncbi:MAG: hypothetical protein WBB94_04865 [Candidatus Saccharimonadaceae bacterium]